MLEWALYVFKIMQISVKCLTDFDDIFTQLKDNLQGNLHNTLWKMCFENITTPMSTLCFQVVYLKYLLKKNVWYDYIFPMTNDDGITFTT